jgi:hypothetical protein
LQSFWESKSIPSAGLKKKAEFNQAQEKAVLQARTYIKICDELKVEL